MDRPATEERKVKARAKAKGRTVSTRSQPPTESTATTLGGTTASASQIARITQDDSL